MISKSELKSKLLETAENLGFKGDAVEVNIDLLVYSLYTEQSQLIALANELNLSSASKLSSKIRQCMDVMYSVYRGKNPRIMFEVESGISKDINKYDLLYESNKFFIYSAEQKSIIPTQTNNNGEKIPQYIRGIISPKKMKEYKVVVNDSNKYYLDIFTENNQAGNLAKDISEELFVTIDGIEYPTTRIFYDHIHQSVYSPSVTGVSDNKDSIFVLTTPDFGVRLFKRGCFNEETGESGYFPVNSEVVVRYFEYMSSDQLSNNDIEGINLQDIKINEDHLSLEDDFFTKEIERENENSLLYNANLAQHVQGEIVASVDPSNMFEEYFKDFISKTLSAYDIETGKLTIHYIPREGSFSIGEEQMTSFVNKYCKYFQSEKIYSKKATKLKVFVDINLIMSGNLSIDLSKAFEEYSFRMFESTSDNKNSNINTKKINSLINKNESVSYVDSISYKLDGDNSTYNDFADLPIDAADGSKYYYEFIISTNSVNE